MPVVQKLQMEIVLDEKGAVTSINKLDKATDKFGKDVEKTSKKNESMWAKMKKNWLATTAVIVAAIATVKKAFDLTKEFAEYRQGMDALERNTGKNSDKIVQKLREVSKGTVDNKNIMLAANRAVALNVTRDTDKMAQLMEISRLKAKAMGITTTQAFNDLTTGIGRNSPLILDNLGIITKGWDKQAKAAGVAMDSQFILNKILAQGSEELKLQGADILTNAEKFQQFGAAMKNLGLLVGKVLTPLLLPVLGIFTKMAGFVGTAIDKIGKFVSKLTSSRIELELINEQLAKPALLRINEKRLQQLEAGIELTRKRNTVLRETIAMINKEAIAFKNGEKTLGELSEETRSFIRSQNTVRDNFGKGTTSIEDYNAIISKNISKIQDARNEMVGLNEEIKKTIDTPIPEPAKKEKETQEDEKASIEEFYAFVDEQRKLDLIKQQESFDAAKEALLVQLDETNLLTEEKKLELRERLAELDAEDNEFKIETQAEFDASIEELETTHRQNLKDMKDKQLEEDGIRNSAALTLYGKYYEDLTTKQKQMVGKMSKAWEKGMITQRDIANTFVSGFLDGIEDMKSSSKDVLASIIRQFATLIAGKLAAMAAEYFAAQLYPLGAAALTAAAGVKVLGNTVAGQIASMETGGKIQGISHSQGGVHIEAEGGEYMIRKSRVTPDTLPLLEAINNRMGNISNLAVASNRPVRRYQEGGQVQTAGTIEGGLTIEHMEVNANDPEEFMDKLNDEAELNGSPLFRRQ